VEGRGRFLHPLHPRPSMAQHQGSPLGAASGVPRRAPPRRALQRSQLSSHAPGRPLPRPLLHHHPTRPAGSGGRGHGLSWTAWSWPEGARRGAGSGGGWRRGEQQQRRRRRRKQFRPSPFLRRGWGGRSRMPGPAMPRQRPRGAGPAVRWTGRGGRGGGGVGVGGASQNSKQKVREERADPPSQTKKEISPSHNQITPHMGVHLFSLSCNCSPPPCGRPGRLRRPRLRCPTKPTSMPSR